MDKISKLAFLPFLELLVCDSSSTRELSRALIKCYLPATDLVTSSVTPSNSEQGHLHRYQFTMPPKRGRRSRVAEEEADEEQVTTESGARAFRFAAQLL